VARKGEPKVSSNQPETDDVIILGVPNIHEEIKRRFAEEPTERQTRYWLEQKILPGTRFGNLWASGRRKLHQKCDELAGKSAS
jgi:hypothetical protein